MFYSCVRELFKKIFEAREYGRKSLKNELNLLDQFFLHSFGVYDRPNLGPNLSKSNAPITAPKYFA